MGNDGLAVAERIAVIDDVGKLPTRRRRCVENVFMHERQANESHESKDLQPVAVVVGYTEKSRVRVKRDHEPKILRQRRASEELRFPRGDPRQRPLSAELQSRLQRQLVAASSPSPFVKDCPPPARLRATVQLRID